MTGQVEQWRHIVADSLDWKEAHAGFDRAIEGLPAALRGRQLDGYPHSIWQIVEHIRLAQVDLLDFMDDPNYVAPKWPDDYWPSNAAPPGDAAWEASITAIRADRARLKALTVRPGLDLTAKIPKGEGQTYLRTILVAVDHTAYHTGQIVDLRRLLGAWG